MDWDVQSKISQHRFTFYWRKKWKNEQSFLSFMTFLLQDINEKKKHFEENKEAESLIELHDLIRQGVILSHGIYI